jgi:hypothetical protein
VTLRPADADPQGACRFPQSTRRKPVQALWRARAILKPTQHRLGTALPALSVKSLRSDDRARLPLPPCLQLQIIFHCGICRRCRTSGRRDRRAQ